MKKTIFFVAVVMLYSCSKHSPSTTAPARVFPAPQNPVVNKAPLEIRSPDWEIDANGVAKKDLYVLYFSTYPWEYALGTINNVILNQESGVNAKVLLQGSSLDYLGGSFNLKGNDLQFIGAVSLLPDTLKLAIVY